MENGLIKSGSVFSIGVSGEITLHRNLLPGKPRWDTKSKRALLALLSDLADYVNFTGRGDGGVLVQSGFDLNKIPQPVSLKAPTRVVVLDGGNSGELLLKFKSVTGAASYLFQYTTDAALAEGSWVSIAATTTSYTFTGLTKGLTYFCRAVSVGTNQQQMISVVVNRVSQ